MRRLKENKKEILNYILLSLKIRSNDDCFGEIYRMFLLRFIKNRVKTLIYNWIKKCFL